VPTLRLRLRDARIARGLTQVQLGELADVGQKTISSLETRDVRTVDLPVLARLAEALELDPALLLVYERSPASAGRKKRG